MSTLAVVEQILRTTQAPMSVREIVEHAGDALPTKSKTPDTVVARDLSMDLKRKGDSSIFARTAPGRYTMREFVAGIQGDTAQVTNQGITEGAEPTPALQRALQEERSPTRSAEPRPRADTSGEDIVSA